MLTKGQTLPLSTSDAQIATYESEREQKLEEVTVLKG